MQPFYKLVHVVLRFWCKLTGIKFYGAVAKMPPTGKLVCVANHPHALDPLLMALVWRKRQVHFVAKIELLQNKFLRLLGGWVGAIGVNRQEMDLSSLRSMLGTLKEGKVLGIFPEGTRNDGQTLLPFKQGAIVVAAKAQADILPMAVFNAGNFFKFWRARPYVLVGEAQQLPAGKVTSEMIDEYNDLITRQVEQLMAAGNKYLK